MKTMYDSGRRNHYDNVFAKFITIITSLKHLIRFFLARNWLGFLRALHQKCCRAKSHGDDETNIYKPYLLTTYWKLKSMKKLKLYSETKEYAMALKEFKIILQEERGRFCKANPEAIENIPRNCSKHQRHESKRAFIGGSWSDNREDEVGKTKDETCLVAQVPDEICLGINLEPDEWIKDSGCSKHSSVSSSSLQQSINGGNVILRSKLAVKSLAKRKPSCHLQAEYVSAGKACQQALWMKQALIDYGVRLDDIPIMCDNKGAIDLSKNPVQHSRTKHIEIRHHFLRDNVQKGNITIEKVTSEDNIADILTKPLKREPFNYLRLGLGMMEQID
ncbi:hypothetical protein Tco_0318872 [Tanacetum coccineum]